ncbi:MAG TPA: hypothetical protein VFR15_00495, partial [Chloroflexia bacterium]|nr:hypothetical protein [Chloroflexia bacterium]
MTAHESSRITHHDSVTHPSPLTPHPSPLATTRALHTRTRFCYAVGHDRSGPREANRIGRYIAWTKLQPN